MNTPTPITEARQVRPEGAVEPVIKLRGIHKAFGSNVVLDGLDLDLHQGENLVVLGKSGTGKSVLIKIVVGLLEADAGEVEVLGQSITSLRGRALDALRVRVGFSFQHSALYDSMTVDENLMFPMQMNRKSLSAAEMDAEIDTVLRSVGMIDSRYQMPSELSGGQRKRIGIARTLILRPEIMLYDEPTAGLDPVTCGEINDLIVQVKEEYKTSAIVITHDLTSAKETGDRVAMLYDGRVLAEGTFDEVFASTDPRIKSFYDYNFIQGRNA